MSRDLTQVIKGFAILIIMCAHIVGTFDGKFANVLEPRYLTPLGGVGVAIFLLLSGYGLEESYAVNGLAHYWKKKILRVLTPYVLWCITNQVFILISPLSDGSNSPFILRYWFIEYLIGWYVIFYVSYRLFPSYSLSIMIVAGVLMFFIYPSDLQAEQSLSFVCGSFLSRYKNKIFLHRKEELYKIAFILLIIGTVVLGIKQLPVIRTYNEGSLLFKFIQLFIKLPLALSVILFFAVLPKSVVINKPLLFIGMISYELYLVHMPFLVGINDNYFNVVILIIQSFLLAYCLCNLNKRFVSKVLM